jgi:hypothetical protein
MNPAQRIWRHWTKPFIEDYRILLGLAFWGSVLVGTAWLAFVLFVS